jgi:predicted NBD/HSP70 family sugar kinase
VREPGAKSPGEALRMLAEAEGTDPTAGARLHMALMDLAGVLATAVSTINPERLVIAGGVLKALPRLVDRLAPLVLSRLYPKAAEGLGILPGALGSYPAAVGASRIALDYLPV